MLKNFIDNLYGIAYRIFGDKIFPFENKVRSLGNTRSDNKNIDFNSVRAYKGNNIYIDVSDATHNFEGAGTFRVLRNICYHLKDDENIVFVQNIQGVLYSSNEFFAKLNNSMVNKREYKIKLKEGDIFFILDVPSSDWKNYEDLLDELRNNGVTIFGMVHDLFAIIHPEWFNSKHFCINFKKWNELLITKCDALICNSKATAFQVENYIKEKHMEYKSNLNLYYFHMGYEIGCTKPIIRNEIKGFVTNKPTFLMVGSVEPRKGYPLVYNVFSKISKEQNIQLLIVGKSGWKNKEFRQKYEQNKDINLSIRWYRDIGDKELKWLYLNCYALIAASKDEGYGLPLVEAASNLLPVVCSDIPIFHEVMGDYAIYFQCGSEKSLIDKIITIRDSYKERKDMLDDFINTLYTWEESAREIKKILLAKVCPFICIDDASYKRD